MAEVEDKFSEVVLYETRNASRQFLQSKPYNQIWKEGEALGVVSKKYESGFRSDAVSADTNNTASYGLYQFNSGQGTVKEFLDYLRTRRDKEARAIAERLSSNIGDVNDPNGNFAKTWRSLARDPKIGAKFAHYQELFTRERYYRPQAQWFSERGVDLSRAPLAVREAVLSSSVHHGVNGSRNLFEKSMRSMSSSDDWASFLNTLYKQREKKYPLRVPRYENEYNEVKWMLESPQAGLSPEERARVDYGRVVTGALNNIRPYHYYLENKVGKDRVPRFERVKDVVEKQVCHDCMQKYPGVDFNKLKTPYSSWSDVEETVKSDPHLMSYYVNRSASYGNPNYHRLYVNSLNQTEFGRMYEQSYMRANPGVVNSSNYIRPLPSRSLDRAEAAARTGQFGMNAVTTSNKSLDSAYGPMVDSSKNYWSSGAGDRYEAVKHQVEKVYNAPVFRSDERSLWPRMDDGVHRNHEVEHDSPGSLFFRRI
ncbi:MAG: hypothetical protein QXP49_02955 [Nitrososphaerota archaeon]